MTIQTPEFPTTRFTEADATPLEIEQLIGEFERSDFAVQSSLVNGWTGQSTGDLRAELGVLREQGHFEGYESPVDDAEASADDADGESGHDGSGTDETGSQGRSKSSKDSGEDDPEGDSKPTE